MTHDIPRRYNRVKVITGVQRRRQWTPEEKIPIVEEILSAGDERVACRASTPHCRQPALHRRRQMAQRALAAASAGGEVVAVAEYRVFEAQTRGLHRLLGKKTMENEPLWEAASRAAVKRNALLHSTSLLEGGR